MKKLAIGLMIVSGVAVGGAMLYLKSSKPALPQAAAVAPIEITAHTPEPETQSEPAPLVKAIVREASPAHSARPADAAAYSASSEPAIPATPHQREVDVLISAETGYSSRNALLRQLKKSGDLDAVIDELRKRAADNPNDAWAFTAIGESLMAKFPIQDYNEMAMLGLQINRSFDAALKLDPSNWEAQFSKAYALAGWPPQMNTGPEVIRRLSSLIDQQETMTPQAQFAQTYLVLGNQYQKAGQNDYAQATWRMGLEKFPGDAALRKKVSNP
jgi:tetratricopeptide (TPR) repeat protein